MNNIIKLIGELKSVRTFSNKSISKEDMEIILKSCIKSATASARQTYSIIVIDDKKVMKKIGYIGDKMLIFNVDYNRYLEMAEYLGYKESHEISISDFITGSTDTILAVQTAVIAAKSLGIDSLVSNCIHRGNIARVYELLDLPSKYCFPVATVILGYSHEISQKNTEKGRLYNEGVVHYNKYNSLDEEMKKNIVAEYDNPNKHFLSLISNWKENDYTHYLDYFYEKWCQFEKISNKRDKKIELSINMTVLKRC